VQISATHFNFHIRPYHRSLLICVSALPAMLNAWLRCLQEQGPRRAQACFVAQVH